MSDPEEVSRRSFAAAAASAALGTLSLSDELSAQELSGDTLKSEFLFDVVFDVSTPFNLGSRQIVPVTGGTFAGPKLKGGRHINLPETPMANLLVSLLNKVGVPTEQLGDSTGQLSLEPLPGV